MSKNIFINKKNNLPGSAILVSIIILGSVFIVAFGSAYMSIVNMSRGVSLSENIKSEEASRAGIERFKFEFYSNGFDASGACDDPIFSSQISDDLSYTIYCDDSTGKNVFYSLGVYKDKEVLNKIKAKGLFEDCGDYLFYEGELYGTVEIGDQCWMNKNLNIGTEITQYENPTDNYIIEKFCYSGDYNFCDSYGGLYTWDEAMQYVNEPMFRGICPDGWHIPSDEEFKELESFLGMDEIELDEYSYRGNDELVGGKMKSTRTDLDDPTWTYPNTNASNESGFLALPGGRSFFNSEYNDFEEIRGLFSVWSSSVGGDYKNPMARLLSSSNDGIAREPRMDASYGLSIRCLKD
ncbi:hypothetical protein CVU82_01140 [Candidatus Falkowbacteria bacterium HGW-Falkowbacteria-1]|jgi:uncharacterized protein (TIGR02145 family)|uniref:Fibrobacter succinogenes major paralogous domain-containing protein n=1 Tax=Candidatus Falkowbacteria bacterium HGW-Falkowbacteria-1 TaxID=2013768 RepID=A0A2N2EAU4_9BACT|nr:MAG: hypothetical protein CVU82_01140 [Candidatus Falkowbacteria bacterium HGW-Falkowbacteria-1]